MTNFKTFPRFFWLGFIAVVMAGVSSGVQAKELEFLLMLDRSVLNHFPGTDGLLGTADDVVSDQTTPMNTSAPNAPATFSYNAFDFGSGMTEAPLLPTGFNAITFVDRSITIDTEAFAMGGAIMVGWDINGTEPFIGHGPYDSQMTQANSGTYNTMTGAFTLNVDFVGNLTAGTAEGMNFDFAGEAWLVDSGDFATFNSNAYVRDVLIPIAQDAGASKVVYIDGSGTVPASSGGSGGSFPEMPVKGVFAGIYLSEPWLVNDFNGDKRTDLPWRRLSNGQNRMWLMNGPVREMAGSFPSLSPEWIAAGTGDFDGDGNVDFYWRNTMTGANRIWFMDGLTRTGFERTLRMKDTDWHVGAICDLNNDGYADIIWRHNTFAGPRAWLMKGATQIGRGALPLSSIDWYIAGCADIDGDGNADIMWRHNSLGQNRIWLMEGVTRVDSGAIQRMANSFRVGGLGDFTQDRNADILFHNDMNGQSRLWEMDGLTRVSASTLKLQNPMFSGAAIGDFGGDDKLDIFWRDMLTGKNQIWNMDGATRLSIDGVVVMPPDFTPIP